MTSLMDEISITSKWRNFYRLNNYYRKELLKLSSHIIPLHASIIEFGSKGGELLSALSNKVKVGVEYDAGLISYAKKRHPQIRFIKGDNLNSLKGKKFDYILLTNILSEVEDIQIFLKGIKKISHEDTKIVVFYFNLLWKPALDLGEKLGLKMSLDKDPNWLSVRELENLFHIESYEVVRWDRSFLAPYNFPFVSDFVNKYVAPLPFINNLCLINYSIFRLKPRKKNYSTSVVIPARNEEGNIRGILQKIPKLGTSTEVIFVEGFSKDNTYLAIKDEIKKYKGPLSLRLFKGRRRGKGSAVRLGFSKAAGELLMILDADLTVAPSELPKFYDAASLGLGDLIIGSRLIYPMEKDAMRFLNYVGNRFFSWAFTFLLGQSIKDTLCGTKVILKRDYSKIVKNRKIFGDFDPFGDFDLIFGAAKLNLKILEIPVRYRERTYGKTNISRFEHGLLLLRMLFPAAKKLKFM